MATNCCDTELDGATSHGMIIVDAQITGGTMTSTLIGRDCDNGNIFAGDRIATCANLTAGLGRKQDRLFRCDGTAMPGNQRIPTCDEVADDIANATRNMITGVVTTGGIVGNGRSSNPVKLELEEDNAYENKAGVRTLYGALPLTLIGGNGYMLGRPAAWLKVNTKAGVMMVPAWSA